MTKRECLKVLRRRRDHLSKRIANTGNSWDKQEWGALQCAIDAICEAHPELADDGDKKRMPCAIFFDRIARKSKGKVTA